MQHASFQCTLTPSVQTQKHMQRGVRDLPSQKGDKALLTTELFWEGQDPGKSCWESTGPYFTFTLILTGNLKQAEVLEASCYFLQPLLASQHQTGYVRSLIHPHL